MSLSLSTAGLTKSCPGSEEVTQSDKERGGENQDPGYQSDKESVTKKMVLSFMSQLG